jgi:hypothetical protein
MCCCCCCRCLSSLCCPCMSFPPPPSSSDPVISLLLLPPPPTAPVTQLVVIVLFPLTSSQKQTPRSLSLSLSLSLSFAEVFLLLRLSTPKLLPKLRTKAAESKIRRKPVRHYHSPIIRKQNQKNLTSSNRDRRTHPPQTAALDLKPGRRQDTPGCSLKSVLFFPEIPRSHSLLPPAKNTNFSKTLV